jgi:hypothetical protein
LEEVFKITVNLEIESALLGPMIIIVQFILWPDLVSVENSLFWFSGLCETQCVKERDFGRDFAMESPLEV